MGYTENRQDKIDKAIKAKNTRMNKTEMSIGFRWAVNCAVATLTDGDKNAIKNGDFDFLKNRAEKFMEWDREYMLENMPLEYVSLEDTGEAGQSMAGEFKEETQKERENYRKQEAEANQHNL